MFPSDDPVYNTSYGPIDRSARVAYRREIINEKRQRHTDMLPKIDGEMPNGKTTSRQIAQLREENKRFRWKIDKHQHLIYQYRQTQTQLEREIENLHRSKQNEIEQYEIHLREAIEELNQLEATNQELKRSYQNSTALSMKMFQKKPIKWFRKPLILSSLLPNILPPLYAMSQKQSSFI